MLQSVNLVEEIKRILVDPEGVSSERIEELARQYGEACDNLNKNLSLIASYLSMGFYCEAARITKEENVVDEYQTLLFEQDGDWRATCRELNCEIKAVISQDNGGAVQEFILSYEDNCELFALNRRLAFADAPAAKRLDVLYKLSKAFSTNSRIWERQIVRLENRRNAEIDEYLQGVKPSNADERTAREILSELEVPGRKSKASPKTLYRLNHIIEYTTNERLKRELKTMIEEWSAAVANNDSDEALEFLENYRDFSECYPNKVDDFFKELSTQEKDALQQALDYSENLKAKLDSDEELRRCAHELTRLVEREADESQILSALSALENAAGAAGLTNLPPAADYARLYLDELNMKKRRSTMMKVVAAAVLIGFFAAGVVVVTYRSALQKKAVAAAEEICAQLDEYEKGDVEAVARAEKRVQKVRAKNAKLLNDPAVEAAVERFEATKEKESQRLTTFKDLVEQLKILHIQDKDGTALLVSLKKVAKTDEEKSEYNKLASEDNKLRAQANEKASSSFSATLDKLKADFEKLKNRDAELEPEEALQETALISRGLQNLANISKSGRVTPALETARQSLETALNAYEREKTQVSSSNTLSRFVGDQNSYKTALTRVARNFQLDATQATDLYKTVDYVPAINSWNDFVANYGGSVSEWGANVDIREVTSALEECDAQVVPEFINAQNYCAPLKEKSVSIADLLAELVEEFDPYKEPTWTLYHEGNGRYYYLDAEITLGKDEDVHYKPSLSGDPRNFSSAFMEDDDTVSQAIQYRIYKALSALSKNEGSNLARDAWFETIQNITELVVNAREEELDPVLKAILCYRILDVACRDSAFASFKEWFDAFDQKKDLYLDADFYKQDSDFAEIRTEVKKLLAQITSRKLEEKIDAVKTASTLELASYEWIGFVDEVDGSWAIVGNPEKKPSVDDASLFLTRIVDGKPAMVNCGELIKGKVKASRSILSIDRWTPVYAKIPYAE